MSAAASSELSPATRELFASQLAELQKVLARRQESADKLNEISRDADAVRDRCRVFSNFVRESWHTIEGGRYIPNWHVDAIGAHIEALHKGQLRRLLINIPPGMMKALDDDTPVFTTWGWKRHGDLKPGDYVYGLDGLPKKVTACTVSKIVPTFRVEFDDRAEVVAAGDHLWSIERDVMGPKPKYRRMRQDMVVRTDELQANARQTVDNGKRPDRIVLAKAVQYAPRRFLIDPYLLGVWLGDGTSESGQISVGEEDINYFAKLGRISTVIEPTGFSVNRNYRVLLDGMQTKLRLLGILGNKHIPLDYLECSEEQRWELVRGLMDTDGHATKDSGRCQYTTKLECLAFGVRDILCSLGMKVFITESFAKSYNGDVLGPYYNLGFTAPEGTRPFNLPRKMKKVGFSKGDRTQNRYVKSVTPAGERSVKCISVEGEIYLAGRCFVPTHNSTTVSVMLGPWEWGPMQSPHLKYLTTTYEATYARRDSRKHRDMVLSEWFQKLWPMRLVKYDEANFENEYKGGRMAVPYARLTAGRGNRLIIDDPHSVKKAESEVQRRETTMLFRESAQSRLNNQETDAILVMMQRLHPDDLTGVIDELRLPYTKLVLPMEHVRSLSVKTPYFEDKRREGELLCPGLCGPERAAELRIASTEHGWATQYQQQPRSRKGSSFFNEEHFLVEEIVKHVVDGKVVEDKTYKPVPWGKHNIAAVFSIADTATKVGGKRDGTGTIHCGFVQHPKPLLLILDWNLIQIQADTLPIWLPKELEHGEQLARDVKARFGYQRMWIEDKDSGQALLQFAAKQAKLAKRVKPIPSELTALGKEGRAVSVSGYISRGLVKVTDRAYDKVSDYHGRSANHLMKQLTEFRVGQGTPLDEDELFDCGCYSAAVTFGDGKGL